MKRLPIAIIFCALSGVAQAESLTPFEEAGHHYGDSFQVNVPCAEQAVRDFMGGHPSEFNSEVGLIAALEANTTAIVALHGERAESDLGFVSWIDVSSINGQAHIGLDSLVEAYSYATSTSEIGLESSKMDVEELKAHLQICRPIALTS